METKSKTPPRGIRNNNPLNIRRGKSKWKGETYLDCVDDKFCQFETMIMGWRAALYLIRRYIKVWKCNTIRKIVSRWAPMNENNTIGYVNRVCDFTGINPDTEIRFEAWPTMVLLASAMCVVENGKDYNPFSSPKKLGEIFKAWEMVNNEVDGKEKNT